jgi:YgiT-type zinc finger domain-containing protein
MKCVVCKIGETKLGRATVTLEREGIILVFKNVPADICSNCGEEYVDQGTTSHLMEAAEQATQTGIQVDVREYLAA